MRLALAIFFVLLCVLDNIFTYEVTRWPIYQEVAPLAIFMLSIPYGLWIQKFVVCSLMYCFRKKISNQFLIVLSAIMLLIVCNNGYLYCKVIF
jgi:hypothetical protein